MASDNVNIHIDAHVCGDKDAVYRRVREAIEAGRDVTAGVVMSHGKDCLYTWRRRLIRIATRAAAGVFIALVALGAGLSLWREVLIWTR